MYPFSLSVAVSLLRTESSRHITHRLESHMRLSIIDSERVFSCGYPSYMLNARSPITALN